MIVANLCIYKSKKHYNPGYVHKVKFKLKYISICMYIYMYMYNIYYICYIYNIYVYKNIFLLGHC